MHWCSPSFLISLIILNQQNYSFSLYSSILVHSYHPIYFSNIAAKYGAFPIPYIFNGALTLPIASCFHCTLNPPIPMGHKISHRAPFHPISSWGTLPSHLIFFFLDLWGTCPSHSHLQL